MQNDERPVKTGRSLLLGGGALCEYVRMQNSPHVPQAALKVRLMEPLVLIHGFSGIPAMWEPMIPALQEQFDVRALGLAGHYGCATLPEGVEASATALFDALERDLDEAEFETAHICGNSLGGWAALELARRGRARSCVAIAPAGGWEAGSKEENRLKWLFKRLHATSVWANPRREKLFLRPKLRQMAMRDVVEHGERMTPRQAADLLRGSAECPIYWDLFDAIRRDGPPADFDGIDCPTTIVWGTKDRIIPLKGYSERIRRLVPQAGFVVLDGAGHSPMVDEPERLVRIIAETASRARQGVTAGEPAA
jgi:pimeloyl-ACP methyl ester carboxylesterase